MVLVFSVFAGSGLVFAELVPGMVLAVLTSTLLCRVRCSLVSATGVGAASAAVSPVVYCAGENSSVVECSV